MEALEVAGKPPVGGRDVVVQSRGSSDAVVSKTGHQIIPRRQLLPAILQGSINFRVDVNGFNVEYTYPWVEAEIDPSGEWIVKPMGKASTDPTRTDARNYAELLNGIGDLVQYGIPIDSVPPEPAYHIDGVFPIPINQPVVLFEGKIEATGVLVYYFEATGRLNIICGVRGVPFTASSTLPPRRIQPTGVGTPEVGLHDRVLAASPGMFFP